MNIAGLLERTARVAPERPALFRGESLIAHYDRLRDDVARRAAWLLAQGLSPGDRVAICLNNCERYIEFLYATIWAGLTVVPINAKLHAREIDYIAGHADAGLLIVDSVTREGLSVPSVMLSDLAELSVDAAQAPLHDCQPDDLAWLFYTSGTTGRPKGVMLSHRNLTAMTLCYGAEVEQPDGQDAWVYAAPISHGAGLYTFAYTSVGARHVVPASGGFDAAELCDLAGSLASISVFAAPTMVRRLVDHVASSDRNVDGFKSIVYGGGPMYLADIERARRVMGPRFVQIYGQGETPMTITYLPRAVIEDDTHPRWKERLASVGIRQAVVDVHVVDPEGKQLPIGTTGEVVVRGDTVMQGYWRDEAASVAALRDGWLHTGDLGAFDAEGFLTLKDRSKDLIISGGSNIYPREVEEVLLLHDSVTEVAVVGVADAEWGESVVAFVVTPNRDVPVSEFDDLCLAHIARFKRPKRYLRVDELPKNSYGKVLKTALRRQLEGSDGRRERE